jgi:hypothetical protein
MHGWISKVCRIFANNRVSASRKKTEFGGRCCEFITTKQVTMAVLCSHGRRWGLTLPSIQKWLSRSLQTCCQWLPRQPLGPSLWNYPLPTHHWWCRVQSDHHEKVHTRQGSNRLSLGIFVNWNFLSINVILAWLAHYAWDFSVMLWRNNLSVSLNLWKSIAGMGKADQVARQLVN